MSPSESPWNGEAFVAAATSVRDHFSLAERFVAEWYPPMNSEERIPQTELDLAEKRLGLKFPPALRRWYDLVGNRGAFTGNGDWLRKPSELQWSDGVLELLLENQGVWRIGLSKEDLHLPDPPLRSYDREKHGRWSYRSLVTNNFSTFMLLWALYSVKNRAPFSAETLDPVDISRLFSQFPCLPLPKWELFHQCPLAYHAGEDLLIEITGQSGSHATSVWVSARDEVARNRVVSLIDCDWDCHET